MNSEMKVCRRCEVSKLVSDFPIVRAKSRNPVRHSYCRPCVNEYNREYRQRRGLKRSAFQNKRADLKKNYGVSVEDVQERLRLQYGVCPICLRSLTLGAVAADDENVEMDRLTAHVDHDHRTGQVRGLLCSDCNRGLGCFRDSTFSLELAVEYLRDSVQ